MRRDRLLLIAMGAGLLVGCGGDGDGDGAKNPDFVGTWHYANITTATFVCTGGALADRPPTNDVVLQDAIGGGIVDVSVSPIDRGTNCSFGYDVAGTVATARANQVCSFARLTLDPTQPATLTPTNWKFSLVEGPNLAEEIGTATFSNYPIQDASGAIFLDDCVLSLSARLTRVAAD